MFISLNLNQNSFINFKNINTKKRLNLPFNGGLKNDIFVPQKPSLISFSGNDDYAKRVKNLVSGFQKRNQKVDFRSPEDFFQLLSKKTEINEMRLKWLEKTAESHPEKNILFLYNIANSINSNDKGLAQIQLDWVTDNIDKIEDNDGYSINDIISSFNKNPKILDMQLKMLKKVQKKGSVNNKRTIATIFSDNKFSVAKEKYDMMVEANSKGCLLKGFFLDTLQLIDEDSKIYDLQIGTIKKLIVKYNDYGYNLKSIVEAIDKDREKAVFQLELLDKILKKAPNIPIEVLDDLFSAVAENIEDIVEKPDMVFKTLKDIPNLRKRGYGIGSDLKNNIKLLTLKSDWAEQQVKKNPKVNKNVLIECVLHKSTNEDIAQMEYAWVEKKLKEDPFFKEEYIGYLFSSLSSQKEIAEVQLKFADLYFSKERLSEKKRRFYQNIDTSKTDYFQTILNLAYENQDIAFKLCEDDELHCETINEFLLNLSPRNKDFVKKLIAEKVLFKSYIYKILCLKNSIIDSTLIDEIYTKIKEGKIYPGQLDDFNQNNTAYSINDVVKVNQFVPYKKLETLEEKTRIILYTFADFLGKKQNELSIDEKIKFLNKLMALPQYFYANSYPAQEVINFVPGKSDEYLEFLNDFLNSIKYHYNNYKECDYDEIINSICSKDLITNGSVNEKMYKQMLENIPEFENISLNKVFSIFKYIQNLKETKEFQALNASDKKVALTSLLLKDLLIFEKKSQNKISITNLEKIMVICEKLNLTKSEKIKLRILLKTHDWFEDIDELSLKEQNNKLMNLSFDFKNGNLFDMRFLLTETQNNFDSEKIKTISKYKEQIAENIKKLKESQPFLPITKMPTASKIKEGISVINSDGSTNIKGVYVDKKGLVILKFNEIEEWEKIGFPKGSTTKGFFAQDTANNTVETGNIKFFVHGLSEEASLERFKILDLFASDAVLSVSYAEKPETKYRFFKGQGLIINVDTENIYVGGKNDTGSGYNKNIDFLKKFFHPESAYYSERKFIADLLKNKMDLNSQEYVEFWEKYKNKSFLEVEDETLRKQLIETLASINSEVKYDDREYNEFLVTTPEIMGVFVYKNDDDCISMNNPIEFLNNKEEPETDEYHFGSKPSVYERTKYLQKYALKKDIPLVIFGK